MLSHSYKWLRSLKWQVPIRRQLCKSTRAGEWSSLQVLLPWGWGASNRRGRSQSLYRNPPHCRAWWSTRSWQRCILTEALSKIVKTDHANHLRSGAGKCQTIIIKTIINYYEKTKLFDHIRNDSNINNKMCLLQSWCRYIGTSNYINKHNMVHYIVKLNVSRTRAPKHKLDETFFGTESFYR